MIRRTSARIYWCVALLCINVVFIWGNSMLPGQVSGDFSQYVLEVLENMFSLQIQHPSGGHGLLRKLAHFSEFCCLGILLSWLLRMLQEKTWMHYAIPFFAGFAVACIDETIQYFVPDRGPGLLDVLIDTSGVSVGILLVWTIILLRKNKTMKNRRMKQ